MKVLRYASINITEQQILALANVTRTHIELKSSDPDFEEFQSQFRKNYGCVHMNLNRQSDEDRFLYRGIIYDKLLIAIRDTVLLPEEVFEIRAEYTKDLHKQSEMLMLKDIDEINVQEHHSSYHDTAAAGTGPAEPHHNISHQQ